MIVKKTASRILVVYIILMLSFGLLPMRFIEIYKDSDGVGKTSSSKSIEIAESRGLIYGNGGERLVGDTQSYISVIRPGISAMNELKRLLERDAFAAAANELNKNNPIVLQLGNTATSEDIITTKIYKRYSDTSLASHIIGYLDESGNGVTGIEKSFNDYLNEHSGRLRARFYAQANGDILAGVKTELINENYNSDAGVVLTIDKKMQTALENAMNKCGLKKGAGIILRVDTGEIAAIASRPDFDRNDIASCLNDDNLPLFNRALGAYPVGSVFKPLVAVCALEQGIEPEFEYYCDGNINSGGKNFGCLKAHGNVILASALCYSCNCYFINLIENIDCENVVEAASYLGFGSSVEFANGIKSYSGNLPDSKQLESAAARANFSFGQGSLSANIIQVASLYAAVANEGKYIEPYLVDGLCDENGVIYNRHASKAPYRLFSRKNTELISSFLELAVREGTGTAAAVQDINVCGKTATAQSGEYINGRERLVTWFAGYFPYDKPEYAVVILCEDGESGSVDCAPIFSAAVTALINNK